MALAQIPNSGQSPPRWLGGSRDGCKLVQSAEHGQIVGGANGALNHATSSVIPSIPVL